MRASVTSSWSSPIAKPQSACYRSAEYQEAKAIRQQCADADFIIVEGA